MPLGQKWILQSRPKGQLELSDFRLMQNLDIPDADRLEDDEIVVKALFLSVDPITRLYASYGMEAEETVPGRQVARVLCSKHKEYPKGKFVVGPLGWQTHTNLDPDSMLMQCEKEYPLITALPRQLDSALFAKSAALGILGLPGLMAYSALIKICEARKQETLVVTSAGGQIGHILAQLGKILEMNVIAFVGDSDKASWLKLDLNVDWVFNYKSQDPRQTLRIAAPKGVDVFIDSVGGALHAAILAHMAPLGRICVLGNLDAYNRRRQAKITHSPPLDVAIALKELSITGFNALRHPEWQEEAMDALSSWCKSGKLRPHEHVVEGFQMMPQTLIQQLEGKFKGKVVVRV